ncbi:MAG: alpha-ketoglutarate-dependent dioxygenase AlkB family protein [Marinomonas sp.]
MKGGSLASRPSYLYSFSSSSWLTLLSRLKTDLEWHQEVLMMFGKAVCVPRKVAFLADKECCYSYSGKDHYGVGWPDWLLEVKQEAEYVSGQEFNSVLVNWYQDGEDYMGWHADDEKILGPAPVIAMLSLGVARDFLFRRKSDHSVKHSIGLENATWLIMGASTQVLWQHSLPKRKRVKEERISLTFRLLLG